MVSWDFIKKNSGVRIMRNMDGYLVGLEFSIILGMNGS